MDATLTVEDAAEGTVAITLTGDWLLTQSLPGIGPVLERIEQPEPPAALRFDATSLGEWDTGLVASLVAIRRSAEANDVGIDESGLPDGAWSSTTTRFRRRSTRACWNSCASTTMA